MVTMFLPSEPSVHNIKWDTFVLVNRRKDTHRAGANTALIAEHLAQGCADPAFRVLCPAQAFRCQAFLATFLFLEPTDLCRSVWRQSMERHHFNKDLASEQEGIAVSAVALQDHIIHSHQLQDLSLADPLKSRSRNIRNTYRAVNKEMIKAVVDTGLQKRSTHQKNKEDEDEEYVLDPNPPRLTLAQKLGLVEPPSLPLTAEEWARIKQRSIQHGDSTQPCAICREEFALQPQVLLSCSHVFHKACLKAFEKFTGKKSCPMCRKQQYQTRVIHDGARLYKIKCATRIQSSWRGYVVRKWYKNLRKTVPPKDSKLRKQFFEEKVQQISDRLLSSFDVNLDDFLSKIDSSIAACRDAFQQLEGEEMHLSEEDWEKIQMQAFRQEVVDCPICITPLSPAAVFSGTSNPLSRQTVLLSCSHLFHQTCLEAFEEFSLGVQRICPLCRSCYRKKVLKC